MRFQLLLLHSFLMLVGFGVTLTFSAIIARYFRGGRRGELEESSQLGVHEPPTPSKTAWWFVKHTQLHFLCVVIGGVGLVCAFLGVESESDEKTFKAGSADAAASAGSGATLTMPTAASLPTVLSAANSNSKIFFGHFDSAHAWLGLVCVLLVGLVQPELGLAENRSKGAAAAGATPIAQQRFSKRCQFKTHGYIGRVLLVAVLYTCHLGFQLLDQEVVQRGGAASSASLTLLHALRTAFYFGWCSPFVAIVAALERNAIFSCFRFLFQWCRPMVSCCRCRISQSPSALASMVAPTESNIPPNTFEFQERG